METFETHLILIAVVLLTCGFAGTSLAGSFTGLRHALLPRLSPGHPAIWIGRPAKP